VNCGRVSVCFGLGNVLMLLWCGVISRLFKDIFLASRYFKKNILLKNINLIFFKSNIFSILSIHLEFKVNYKRESNAMKFFKKKKNILGCE